MRKFLLAGAAAFGLMAMGGTANAALSLVGGTAGDIPGSLDGLPGQPGTNEALGPLGFSNPLSGLFGAQVSADAGVVTFTLLGAEIGDGTVNSFTYGSSVLSMTGLVNSFSTAGFGSAGGAVGDGLLAFSFSTNLFGGLTVDNGSNPTETSQPGVLNFFSYQADANTVYLFLDDTGGQRRGGGSLPDDDNHDDLVIKVTWSATPVPEPASLGLLGAGLIGLGVAAKRRRRA